jgi:thymidylate kinase
LVDALNHSAIEYCHWKSNISLDNALAGEEDLDFLVDRKALGQLFSLLIGLGFKGAMVKPGTNVPGIFHYYGLDPHTGKPVHVHLFSSVLSGESFVKSHFLPFERMLLENRASLGDVPIPSRSAELVLFVIRTFIKYGSILDVMRLAGNPGAIRTELRWIKENCNMPEALSLLQKYCPVIDEPLFLKCIQTLDGESPLAERILLALRVRQRLHVYAKHRYLKRLLAYAPVLWARVRRRFAGNRKNKTLLSGGAIIAIVGADATGKSTMVSESTRWLGGFVATRTVHVGKPPSSWLTWPINMGLSLARRMAPQLRHSQREMDGRVSSPGVPQTAGKGSSLLYALRAVTLAWDRLHLLVKVRRAAANGDIVICDRYPTETTGAMDSPRLQEQPGKTGIKAHIYNGLARWESRLYRHMPPPDAVLRLRVSVETAKQRNRARAGSEAEDYLELRHRESREWRKHGTKYLHDIDTEQSLDETILSVKKAIWESL